jgi:two-component system chemotaxis response regulator CheB
MSDELIDKVKTAATIRPKLFHPTTRLNTPVLKPESLRRVGSLDAVVIGISTGGPQGLRYLIPQFRSDFPVPIVVVLHIPVGYTEMYAAKLDEISNLKVLEAREGDFVRTGVVLIAPAGRHLTFRRGADGLVIVHLDLQPSDTLHRPSVDILFESAAEVFGERTLGIVMTGMGSDGRRGSTCIKKQGGRIYTEAEASVVEAGLSDRSIPLDRLAEAIVEVA